ncbi:DNA polymerase IV [Mycoplasmopsis cynos]|uniref:Y-family DNA polymerase n=1 Tax=Mycoplasmopsis cynos TaxID=171284 RepID=UPI002AFE47E0|nr:DNA polymerase IV [Mycoplasmopsis cynos]WQQ16356.1 DNA polymerase IV [Mycoplasmopsis cynos]
MKSNRYIFHIDFDSYFVNAIRTIRPELKNKPVAIAKNSIHSIAVSVSYELRAKGINAGMKVIDIKKIEPNTIICDSRFDLYSTLSSEIFRYLEKNYCSEIEIASIDECFLFFYHNQIQNDEQALMLGKKIQSEILKKFKIEVTIGISYTKFFAKMTTNISKPFGIRLTNHNNYQNNFWELDVEKFHGIGSKIATKLRQIGIYKIKDLANCDFNNYSLREIFGTVGFKYQEALNIDHFDAYNSSTDIKGIGNETTFNTITQSEEVILQSLNSLVKKVSNRLKMYAKMGKVITLVVRKLNKGWVSKQRQILNYTNDEEIIKKVAYNLFYEYFYETELLGIGLRVTNLIESYNNFFKISLFEETNCRNNSKIDGIISTIKAKAKTNNVYTLKDYEVIQNRVNRFGKKITTGIFKK